jgi:hypothetical protein
VTKSVGGWLVPFNNREEPPKNRVLALAGPLLDSTGRSSEWAFMEALCAVSNVKRTH